MGKMTGNEFLVKALQEEGVEKIFGYPGACVIDIFDEIYKQDQVELVLPRHEQMDMPDLQEKLVFVWQQADQVPQILLQELQQRIMTVCHWYVLQDRLQQI